MPENTPDEFSEFLKNYFLKSADATGAMPEPIREPSAQSMQGANGLRDMFLAFLKVGFNEEQSIQLLIAAMVHSAGHQ